MNNFMISQQKFSELFWDVLLSNSENFAVRRNEIQHMVLQQDTLRPLADYNTGTIPLLLAGFCTPSFHTFASKIAEVGTFIGRSTLSMARALDDHGKPGEISTCDYSNGFNLEWRGNTKIIQHFHTSSIAMLNSIDCTQDLLFVDGRLSMMILKC